MFIFKFDHFDWLSQSYSEWRQTSKFVNLKISANFVKMRIWWKFENDLNFLILFHSWWELLLIKFPFEFYHFDWLPQFYSEWRQRSKLVNLIISAMVWICDFGQNSKWLLLLNSIHQENTCKSSLHSNLIILSDFQSFTVNVDKLQNYSIKKTLVNQVCIRIRSFLLTFTVLQWMKTNFKISQFSRFPQSSENAIQVKTWKWLKLLNSVPFIKKTLVNHVYIQIWSFWLTFTVLQWMKTNFKISKFSRFLLRSEYGIQIKISKWQKLLNSVPFIMKTLVNKFTLEFDHFEWLSQFPVNKD